MRKFKRMIALVTVALFVLAFAAPAGAATFSDVSGASSDSVYRLNALGIIDGYPDGTFKPEGNITRAEFAKIAMAAAGNSSSADFLKNATSKFSDVKPGEWYSGWVNLAASLGYIQGYPDGTFKPNANITYAECVTILVRLLGYSDKLAGEWPTEYLVKAAELGITDDVAFSASVPATRGDIAMMTSETLDQNVVVWDKDVDDFAFKKDSDDNTFTLLADKFDGAVYDEEDYRVNSWEVDSDGQFVIEIAGIDDPFTTTVETSFTKDVTLAENAVVDGGTVVPYLGNHLINFIYNSDDEEVTYLDVVSTKIKSDDVDDDGTKLEVNDVSYKFADGCYLTEAPIDTPADEIVFELGYEDEDNGVLNDFYDVFLNDDGKIYYAVEKTSGNPKMVDELESDLTLNYMDSGNVDLDQDDVLIVKDGKYAEVEDLEATDIVYVTEGSNGLDVFVDAYSLSKSGEFEAGMSTIAGDAYFEQVKIGGTKYDLDAGMKLSSDAGDEWSDLVDTPATDDTFFDDIYDEEVQFALDRKGDIAFILTDVDADSSKIYGVVDKVLDDDIDGNVTSLKILKTDGTTVSYDVETADFELAYDDTDDVNFASRTVDTEADETIFDGAAVEFSLNDNGDIDDLEVLDDADYSITDGSKDLKKLYIDGSWYYVNDDTVVLNAPNDDDPDVVSNSSLLGDAEDLDDSDMDPDNDEILCWAKFDGNKVEYVIVVGATVEATADDMAMVIDSEFYDGDIWVTVDIRGTVDEYELSDTGADPVADQLFVYSMTGTKIVLGAATDATATYDVYGEVTDVDDVSFEVADGDYFEIDADSYIYDMTDDDPVFVDGIDGISEGDSVFVIEVDGDDERKGVADIVLIVDEEDLP